MKILGVALVIFFSGCAHKPILQPTGLREATFWEDQRVRVAKLGRFSSKVFFRLDSEKEKVSGKGKLYFSQPNSFRLELRDPLGRLQYVAALSGDEFVAHYPTQNIAYLDRVAGRNYLRRFLGSELNIPELLKIFVGVVPPSWKVKNFALWTWNSEGGYDGVQQKDRLRLTANVDGASAVLKKLNLKAGEGSAQIDYEDFESCCGDNRWFAFSHVVKAKMEHSEFEIQWDDIHPEPAALNADLFRVVLPASTEKVLLK